MNRQGVDRYFYAIMAVIFAVAAVVGFTPNSVAILTGAKENPPLHIHFHAAAMSAWMLLLATQATLIARGELRYHRQIGGLSVYLALTVLALMLYIAWPYLSDPMKWPPVFLLQLKRIVFFAGGVGLALYLRNSHPESHKRLMFIATFAVLDAAFFRMNWFLPRLGIEHNITLGHLYQLLLLIPLLGYDMIKFGRIHRVYLVCIPLIIVIEALATVALGIWPDYPA